MRNRFQQMVADFKAANPSVSHKDAMAAVKNGVAVNSVDLEGFVSVSDHAPKAAQPDSTSGLLDLFLADGSVSQGFFRRWDKRIVTTDCPSSRVIDGYFFIVKDGRETVIDFLVNPVIRFRSLDK